jgi:transaldolase
MSKKPSALKIDIYLDGAEREKMLRFYNEKWASGFTTNPTLMAKAGIKDYVAFCKEILTQIKDAPISFEVFADDLEEMKRQAHIIAALGNNVYVKIPIMNTKRECTIPLIRQLFESGMKLNVTAIFTLEQLQKLHANMRPQDDALVSVFAGRIADSGIDPIPLMTQTVAMFKDLPKAQVLWASTREPINIYQADQCGCHIITVPAEIISKLSLYGKNQTDYSWETVKMFYEDGQKAGFKL